MRRRTFLRDETATTAVEFGLLAMLFIGMMLGIIDMARLSYEINSAKAAARRGARVAVVTLPAAADLANFDGLGCAGAVPGQPVPTACVPADAVCTSTGCSVGAFDAASFNVVVAAMQPYYGRLQASNVEIDYRHRGLGTVGFIGSDVEPLITVRIKGLTFQPIALQIFGVGALPIPSVATTLTAESLGATSAAI